MNYSDRPVMTRTVSIAVGLALLFILGIVAASCSGPRTTTAPPDETEEQPPTRMYRIQVLMTGDQSEAEQAMDRVRAWWRQLPDDERPDALAASGLDPEVVWQQPYYRVRIGLFDSRTEATPVLDAVRAQFGDAFIVPEQVPARQ
jgi:hypothetical protein